MDPNVIKLAMGAGGAGGPDYKLYTWGQNNFGQLGLGNTTDRSSPVQVGALTTWDVVSGGVLFTLAIKNDGTLWAWGRNGNYQLGLGNDTTNRSSPTQIGSLTTWSKVSGGAFHAAAIKTDGTLWAWGNNSSGQLGDGTVTTRSSPVQIGSLTTWSSVSCGPYFTLATRTNGTLWAWGENLDGQLGLGNTTYYSSPVQVGSLTTWSNIANSIRGYHVLATRTDGTLWAWGRNNFGQLGLGNTTYYSSPVQVGGLTTWLNVSCGYNFTLANATGKSLWAWGKNNFGQLGLGDVTYYSSPVQVGSLTTWNTISCGNEHCMAVKTDGTLWTWGWNNNGQLGNSPLYLLNQSSPVQIGSLTTWLKIAGGSTHSIATTKE
jgi:alpha-tubulin suppressor-like RCC1 family protein